MVKSACGLLVVLAASCIGSSLAAEKTFDRRLAAPAGGRLTVDLDYGAVSVVGSDTREVVVHADMGGSEGALSRLTISTQQDASGVRVTERADREGWFHGFGGAAARVHFTIDVPRDYPILITTAGGALDLRSLRASVEATTAGGSITVRDIVGPVDVHTAGGSIWLEKVDGNVAAATSGGSVIAAVLGDHDISLRTSGGSIRLRVQATIRASLDASTLGGSVSSHIPLSSTERIGRSRLQGAINGGGHLIELHTIGGSILLEPLA